MPGTPLALTDGGSTPPVHTPAPEVSSAPRSGGTGTATGSSPAIPRQRRAAHDAPTTYRNPVLDAGPQHDHGDPYVLEYEGAYVLYHSGPHGVSAFTSRDLVSWQPCGIVLEGVPGTWAEVELWAPEVVHRDGMFVMYVAATRRGGEARDAGKAHGADGGDDEARRQGIARAASPFGPFTWDDEPLIDEWSIDGHPFVDRDGSEWLFYNVRNEASRHPSGVIGCGNVVDRLTPEGRLEGRPVPVAFPSLPWEAKHDGSQYWNEGPFTLRRGSRLFQMYSGGWFGGDDYALGTCVADDPRGPWHKTHDGPVFTGGELIRGTGHHSVVVGPDGVSPYAVYHGYVGEAFGRKVHLERLHWAGDGPQVGTGAVRPTRPATGPLARPHAPAHDPAVAAWHARLWARGMLVIDGMQVELPDSRSCLVEARYDGVTLVVTVDHVLVARRIGSARPRFDGDVLSCALTSHLDDDREHLIDRDDTITWAWGSSSATEVSMAVCGQVVIDTGTEAFPVETAQWELVTFMAVQGMPLLRVTALAASRVADVSLTLRT